MQNPVGMEFDPSQMRNVMDDFWAVALNPVAINKFFHAVTSGWTLGGVFVVGVSSWLLWRKSNIVAARKSMKVGAWVGLAGIILTIWTGDGSAVQVAKVQPMKLAAMEGLYRGKCGQELVGFGLLNTDKRPYDGQDAINYEISIPKGLSILANHDANSFVPGIEDLLDGISVDANGDTINTISYAERITIGREAQDALRAYNEAEQRGDRQAMDSAATLLKEKYEFFGYGYLDSPEQAIPPVALTFYSFRIMVIIGGYLLAFFAAILLISYRRTHFLEKSWIHWIAILSIPLVWVCSQAGWIVAEVGRQPWTIQDVLPVNAAISDISSTSVQITFWMFAVLFTLLLIAEISIMLRQIGKSAKTDIENPDK